MTPPVTSSNIRGLLPRRTLEPLMEEEYSDTYTSSSSTSSEGTQTDPSGSSEQVTINFYFTISPLNHLTNTSILIMLT